MSSDRYVYPSDKLKKQAILNLNEDPEQINAQIESLRRWVKSMPHLNCPTDANFLIMFLRVAKYDHHKAQKRLDNFCTIRSSKEKGHPEFFHFPKVTDPLLKTVIDIGSNLFIGINEKGEAISVGKFDKHNPKEILFTKYIEVLYMIFEMYMYKHQEMQVTGFKFFADLHNLGKNAMEVWSNPSIIKTVTRIWQDCYPVRIKSQVVYREPTWYSVFLNIVTHFLHEKQKNRIIRVKDDINKAFETIPGLKEMMPVDYGGKGPQLSKINDELLKEVQEFYKDGGPWKNISVDESKRPKETANYLQQYADYKGNAEVKRGAEGVFTKKDMF